MRPNLSEYKTVVSTAMTSSRVPFLLVDSPASRLAISMEFRVALFFLFLYYIRPQDWVQGLIGFNIIKPVIAIWVISLFASRNRSPLPGILRTPHDWVMIFYFSYILWSSPDPAGTFNGMLPLLVFYVLTVQSLTDWQRLLSYLKAWNLMLLGVAFMAVASLYGLDLTGAVDMTAKNADRLAIGTWLHDNPNSLAHSVVVCIALSYIIYFWRRPATSRLLVFPICAILAMVCAYHTQSKGAYLVGAGLLCLVFVVGRPWPVKILVLAMAATMGISALTFLPRMSQMGNLRADEGVMGRLMAWEMAKNVAEKTTTGQGWRQFEAWITWEGESIPKATHSSYVQISADLGVYGLFLYLAGLWCAAHTLLSVHRVTQFSEDHERVRRALWVLLAGYAASGWMINREYHTEYFLLIAVAAACHRLCLADSGKSPDDSHEFETTAPNVVSNLTLGLRKSGNESVLPQLPQVDTPRETPEASVTIWARLGVIDLAATTGLTWIIFWIWDYILKNL